MKRSLAYKVIWTIVWIFALPIALFKKERDMMGYDFKQIWEIEN